jgi:hypothetical protein
MRKTILLMCSLMLAAILFSQAPLPSPTNGAGRAGTCDTLGGDLSGTCTAANVIKVNNASVPVLNNFLGSNSSGQLIASIEPEQTVTTTLTSAQIKSLGSSSITVLAAQGAGTLIVPVSVTIGLQFGTMAYVDGMGGSPDFEFFYSSAMFGDSVFVPTANFAATFKASESSTFYIPVTLNAAPIASTISVNQPLIFAQSQGSDHDLIDGDGIVVMIVAYRVITGL